MKIVQIVTQMEGGGAQRVAYLLHRTLEGRGHDSELCFLYVKRPTYLNESGVFYLCDHKPNTLDYLRIAKRLYSWIRGQRPDAIVAHTHYANILALCVGWLAFVKIRVAVQHSPVQKYPGASSCLDLICGTLGVYTQQVAVSDAVVMSMEAYPARYRRTVQRIYNGIVLNEDSEEVFTKNKDPHRSLRILHVGRFSVEKNHSLLLQTLARLPGVMLVLVGGGKSRKDIERQVQEMKLQDRVTFLGEISPKDVRAVMRSCDLFMFPSIYEAMPMALLEAMATGMPIVASDIPANRELLQDTGLLGSLDPELFASAATSLFDNPTYASELGRQACLRASQFTVTAMADGYERILRPS
jgi:glycosyltransferase involved in cell wall biosynthesis